MANQSDLIPSKGSNNNVICNNLLNVEKRINDAAHAAKREANLITLLAVSKTKPVSDIVTAYNYGHRHFGENYVQEAVEKIKALSDKNDILWHFIGPLQSNKSKFIAENFDWLHSLDRIKIAKRLNEQRTIYQDPLNVCVQVNIDDENNKAGIAVSEVNDFVASLQEYKRIRCRGLMTIPKAGANETDRRYSFAKMQELFVHCANKFEHFDTLSMGMSQDLELAVEHGATIIRVGTDIFGAR